MGFADKFKDLEEKAVEAAATHKEQVEKGLTKAAEMADKQTGGQYHDQIAKIDQKADEYVTNLNPTDSSAGPA